MKLQYFKNGLLSVECKTFNNMSKLWMGSKVLVDRNYILDSTAVSKQ